MLSESCMSMKTTQIKILNAAALAVKIADYRRHERKIVFTNGCFDILHWGHVSYLQQAKKNDSRVLVIGLNSDRSVRTLEKGVDRPIIPQKERAALLAAMSCVDHVVIFNEPTPEKLIGLLQPDILVKGADWKGKTVAGADLVRARGGKVEFIRYLSGLSTTNIIAKVRRTCPNA